MGPDSEAIDTHRAQRSTAVAELLAGRYEILGFVAARSNGHVSIGRATSSSTRSSRSRSFAGSSSTRPAIARAVSPGGEARAAGHAPQRRPHLRHRRARAATKFLTMEFIEGESSRPCSTRGRLPLARAVADRDATICRGPRGGPRAPASCTATSSPTTCSRRATAASVITDFGIARAVGDAATVARRGGSSARRPTWRPSRSTARRDRRAHRHLRASA